MEDAAVRAELRRAMNQVRLLRIYLVGEIVLSGIGALAFAAAVVTGRTVRPSGPVALAATSVAIVLLAYAYRSLERHPFGIALALALAHSALLVRALVTGEGVAFAAAWTLGFWLVAGRAWQLRRLARRHPDQYISKWMRGEVDPRDQVRPTHGPRA